MKKRYSYYKWRVREVLTSRKKKRRSTVKLYNDQIRRYGVWLIKQAEHDDLALKLMQGQHLTFIEKALRTGIGLGTGAVPSGFEED